jgi:hypothetical protein
MTTASADRSTPRRGPADADVAIGLAVLGVLCLALIPVEIHRAFGLPAHPLILHVPVILVPLLGLTLLASAVWPAFFRRYALAIGAFTVVTLAGTVLTVGAGEAFRSDRGGGRADEMHRLSEHAESGETLRIVMVLVAAVVLLAVLLSRAGEGRLARLSGLAASRPLWIGLRALFAIGAVAAIFFVIRTGHLGAQLTWDREGGGPPAGFTPPGAPRNP